MTTTYQKIYPTVVVTAAVLAAHDEPQDTQDWVKRAFESKAIAWVDDDGGYFRVHTAAGPRRAYKGDYLVHAATGEIDVMAPAVFGRNYAEFQGDAVKSVQVEQAAPVNVEPPQPESSQEPEQQPEDQSSADPVNPVPDFAS